MDEVKVRFHLFNESSKWQKFVLWKFSPEIQRSTIQCWVEFSFSLQPFYLSFLSAAYPLTQRTVSGGWLSSRTVRYCRGETICSGRCGEQDVWSNSTWQPRRTTASVCSVYRQADTSRSSRLDIDGNNQRGMKIVVHRIARRTGINEGFSRRAYLIRL